MLYHELLPYVFKRFSVRSAFRTALPTLGYYALRRPLPESNRMALCTMNILPPMMTVWHHFASRAVGDKADIVIFDCSGTLRKEEFPGARVLPFLNLYASTKADEFLIHIARKRKVGWICDDDMFILDSRATETAKRELADPETAFVSFRPREWWHFEIDGKTFEPGSSYCIAYNRDILVEKEHLSLAPRPGNNHPNIYGKTGRKYDTADYANEVLLRKGYRCHVIPEDERGTYVAGFSGVSGAVMLLNYFRTPEETLSYFDNAPAEGWNDGAMLHGVLAAMLAVSYIQQFYTILKGSPYPLRSLPSHEALLRLQDQHYTQKHGGKTYDAIHDVATLLHGKL